MEQTWNITAAPGYNPPPQAESTSARHPSPATHLPKRQGPRVCLEILPSEPASSTSLNLPAMQWRWKAWRAPAYWSTSWWKESRWVGTHLATCVKLRTFARWCGSKVDSISGNLQVPNSSTRFMEICTSQRISQRSELPESRDTSAYGQFEWFFAGTSELKGSNNLCSIGTQDRIPQC